MYVTKYMIATRKKAGVQVGQVCAEKKGCVLAALFDRKKPQVHTSIFLTIHP